MSEHSMVILENKTVYKDTYYWFLGFKRRKREILCQFTSPNIVLWDKDAYKEYQELQLLVKDFYERTA